MTRRKNASRKPLRPIEAALPPLEERKDRWPALTGLRGLAALAVLFFHAYTLAGTPANLPQPFAWVTRMGWSGVDVFFTLSAFLLTVPLLEARRETAPAGADLRSYAMRRVLRIVPAYYFQMFCLLALAWFGIRNEAAWTSPGLGELFAHSVFWLNAWPFVAPHISPWWTLPVEMGFYLLLPWLATLLRPGRLRWIVLLMLASLAYRFALMHAGLSRQHEVMWVEHLPGRLHQFLLGMLAAYVLVHRREIIARWSAARADALAAMSMLLFLALPALGYFADGRAFAGAPVASPLLLCWHLFAGLLVALLILALTAGATWTGKALASAPMQFFGWISYSLYLWHYPVLLAVREAQGGFVAVKADFFPFLFLGLLFSVAAAGASWWMIERPTQRWARRATMRT
ncbi:acyltransferase family protein [Arenimonas sp.]|uniref:acyltransferase family protein n=1 Tax=Arenimonas sp. TaxID=1872635 RepID=UPI0039E6BD11